MLNFWLIRKYLSLLFQILSVQYVHVHIFTCFIVFCLRLRILLYRPIILMFQLYFKKRVLYFSHVLSVVPFGFVIESWVANEAPYYFVMQPWFDLVFFVSVFFNSTVFFFAYGIVYSFYLYLISVLSSIMFFNVILDSGLWLFTLSGGFVIFCYLVLFFMFFCVASGLYLVDIIFKGPIAGLVLLSREFMSIEDEDLWISSNIFYMDLQIKKTKEFILPLKTKEIEAFVTLIKLFFDEPLRDLQYGIFSGALTEFRRSQRAGFLERRRSRGLLRGLVPKRKFRRFKKHKRSGITNVLLESQQDQFFDKTGLIIPHSKEEKHFYKFVIQNLRFYYIKPPTKKKRRKRLILFKHRIKKQQILSLRFKDRAAFSKKLNSVQGLSFSTDKILPLINDSLTHMQPQVLRNDLVKPYLVPRVNLKNFIFGRNYEEMLYNQYPKIPRFRRFLWFSLPFYLSLTNSWFLFIYSLNSLRRFFKAVGDWLGAKFLGIFFAIFEDSWAMGQFRTRNYSPRQLTLIQFLRLNNLSFVPLWDNPEDQDDSPVALTQQTEIAFSTEMPPKFSSQFNRSKFKKRQEQAKETNSKKGSKTAESKTDKKESEKVKQKKKLKKKAYRKRLRRKRGTTRKNFLVARQRYHFSNVSNVSNIKSPELRLLDLYKLLEYFYFVLTNDSDFYEVMMFSAKVALLRDKYGQAIVSDLLEKSDHKQASKISVIMHVTEDVNINNLSQTLKTQTIEVVEPNHPVAVDSNTGALDWAKKQKRHTFKINQGKMPPHVSRFSRDLLLSYRYRFRF